MKKIENIILDLLKNSLKENNFQIEIDLENLEHPKNLEMGDFSSNIAMVLAKESGKNLREFAEQIHAKIKPHIYIKKIETAGAGFLNFFLSNKFFSDFLKNEKNLKIQKKLSGEKILLEHSSPNLFKPLHVGHLVNNSIGESLGRVFSYSGADLTQVSFPSDVSPGIAKTVWALKKEGKNKNFSLSDIAEAYVYGTKKYQEDENIKKEVRQINKEIYEKTEGENLKIYEYGKNLSLEHFKEITSKLGSSFDGFIFESESEELGKKLVKENIGKIFKGSDGAIIFEGSKFGLFDNVFINSDDFGTYLAKDFGLINIKNEKYNFDKSFTIADVEQKDHFKLVKKSYEIFDKKVSDKFIFLSHGRMSFSGQEKISSRYGNVPLVFDLLEKSSEKVKEKNPELSDEEVEKISIACLKYAILKVSSGKNIVFDFEKALDFSGDSGAYLLYSLVRAKSILKKAGDFEKNSQVSDFEKNSQVSDFEKILYRFEEQVEKSLRDFSPHHIANYLYDLAQEFSSFYEKTKILDSENSDYLYNLKLVEKFSKTLEKGLELLAIEKVEKM